MTALLALILGACRGPLLDLHAEAPARVWAAAPVCAEVAVKAAAAGHSAAWLARLAYRESRLRRDVCPTCGNKRCPHATSHENPCSGSNAPGQRGSAYEGCV